MLTAADTPLLVAFAGGLAGSMHCVGMCGIFPLALAEGGGPRLARQLLYNLGRVNTLVALGALAGAAGAAFLAGGGVHLGERLLAIAAGSFMIAIGLEQLGLLARFSGRSAALVRETLGRALGGVMRSRTPLAPLALGVFNAFLPCQLIYAFAAQAAATASVGRGALTMLAFGLGTVPAMLALGAAPSLLGARVRAAVARAGGVLVIAFGIVTVARGLWPELGHPGHHHH